MSDQKPSPYEIVFGKETWLRGARLGLLLFGLFVAGAALIFLLLSVLTEWSAAYRGVLALVVGPLIGVICFWVYWKRTTPPRA